LSYAPDRLTTTDCAGIQSGYNHIIVASAAAKSDNLAACDIMEIRCLGAIR